MDKHSRETRKLGETEQRLYVLSNWRETDLFSEEEQAILAMTEEVTLLPKGVSDETYNRAAELFDAQYLAQLIMAIITINAWNRIGVATHMIPGE
jgi:alkylhydroperoxidase family enzyme